MGSETNLFTNFTKHMRSKSEALTETCAQLQERLREGRELTARGFQMRFAKETGNKFAMRRICTIEEVNKMEAVYQQIDKVKRVDNQAVVNVPSPVIEQPIITKQKAIAKKPAVDWRKALDSIKRKMPQTRKIVLLAALIIPTLASVSNTFSVSHALSNSPSTAALITGVASATSLLFLWAGVRGVGAWFVVAATLGFEAFCNACSVFKALMASMAYSISTVSGKPSEFLDMVANFTGRDHQDAATWLAIFTALMICGAQVSAIFELKK